MSIRSAGRQHGRKAEAAAGLHLRQELHRGFAADGVCHRVQRRQPGNGRIVVDGEHLRHIQLPRRVDLSCPHRRDHPNTQLERGMHGGPPDAANCARHHQGLPLRHRGGVAYELISGERDQRNCRRIGEIEPVRGVRDQRPADHHLLGVGGIAHRQDPVAGLHMPDVPANGTDDAADVPAQYGGQQQREVLLACARTHLPVDGIDARRHGFDHDRVAVHRRIRHMFFEHEDFGASVPVKTDRLHGLLSVVGGCAPHFTRYRARFNRFASRCRPCVRSRTDRRCRTE